MTYVYTACTVCVTIFHIGIKFRPVSNFTELHAVIQAAHSYALLLCVNVPCNLGICAILELHSTRLSRQIA